MPKTPFDILIVETYTDNEGGEKYTYDRVGVCFELPSGGFSCKTKKGVALTDEFIIKERQPKNEQE